MNEKCELWKRSSQNPDNLKWKECSNAVLRKVTVVINGDEEKTISICQTCYWGLIENGIEIVNTQLL